MYGCQWIKWSIIQGVMVFVINGAQVIAQLMLFILLLLQCHYCWTNRVSTDRLAASYSLKYLCIYLLPVTNPPTGLFNWRAVKSNVSEWAELAFSLEPFISIYATNDRVMSFVKANIIYTLKVFKVFSWCCQPVVSNPFLSFYNITSSMYRVYI